MKRFAVCCLLFAGLCGPCFATLSTWTSTGAGAVGDMRTALNASIDQVNTNMASIATNAADIAVLQALPTYDTNIATRVGAVEAGTNNWNTAYGWGDHSSAGYLTNYTETDPVWNAQSGSIYSAIGLKLDASETNNLATAAQVDLNDLRLTRLMSSSEISGMELSINGSDPSKFDIATGFVEFVDNTTDIDNPTITTVVYTGSTANVLVDLATEGVTYIYMDSSQALTQTHAVLYGADIRTNVLLGALVHPNNTSISSVDNRTHTIGYGIAASLADLYGALGGINLSGNVYSANGANLYVNRSAGELLQGGINYGIDKSNPNIISVASGSAISLVYRYSDGAGGANVTVTNAIDPGHYDDDTGGTPTPNGTVANNKFTLQKLYFSPASGSTVIEYGQVVYSSIAEAKASKSVTTVRYATPALQFRGWLVVKGNATDLSDPDQAEFIEADRFGSTTSGSSATGGSTTLQQAYNNSITPEIVTDSTRGAVTFKRGSAADTNNVIEVQNGAGDIVFTVTGEGQIPQDAAIATLQAGANPSTNEWDTVSSAATNIITANPIILYTNSVHALIVGQSFSVGSSDDGAGDLAGEFLTGMTNCYLNAYTFLETNSVAQNYTGAMYVQNTSFWSAGVSFSQLICDTLGQDVYVTRVGLSGCPLTSLYPGTATGDFMWANITNEVAVTESTWTNAGPPDVVLLMQGENETGSSSGSADYANRLNAWYGYVMAKWPNANVILAGHNLWYYENQNPTYLSAVINAKKSMAEAHDNVYYVEAVDTHYGASHHPDSLGNIQWGAIFAEAYLGMVADRKMTGGIYAEALRGDYVGASKLVANKAAAGELRVTGTAEANDLYLRGNLYFGGTVFDTNLSTSAVVPYAPTDLDLQVFWKPVNGSPLEVYKNSTIAAASADLAYATNSEVRRIVFDDGQFRNSSATAVSGASDGTCTISCWIKSDGTGTAIDQDFTGFRAGSGGDGLVLRFDNTTTNATTIGISYNNESAPISDYTASGTIDLGSWHMVSATADATTSNAYIYVDGQQVGHATDYAPGGTFQYLYCGRSSTQSDVANSLLYDDFQAYGRVLAPSEMSNLYELQKVGGSGFATLPYDVYSGDLDILVPSGTNTIHILDGIIRSIE